MALKKTIVSSQGFEVVDAYHRVENLQLADKENVAFRVYVYKDVSFDPFNEKAYACSYNLNGENPLKQAYEYLKTLPEFSGATDC